MRPGQNRVHVPGQRERTQPTFAERYLKGAFITWPHAHTCLLAESDLWRRCITSQTLPEFLGLSDEMYAAVIAAPDKMFDTLLCLTY